MSPTPINGTGQRGPAAPCPFCSQRLHIPKYSIASAIRGGALTPPALWVCRYCFGWIRIRKDERGFVLEQSSADAIATDAGVSLEELGTATAIALAVVHLTTIPCTHCGEHHLARSVIRETLVNLTELAAQGGVSQL